MLSSTLLAKSAGPAAGSFVGCRPVVVAYRRSAACPSSAASELRALLCDVTGLEAILCDPDTVHTVQQLASGGFRTPQEHSCDAQGLAALEQLLAGHLSPQQQQALSAASAAAAAAPPQLSAQQELSLLLQEPLIKTALRRMRSDPELGLSTYGSNPCVSRSLQLLDQVLAGDSAISQVVDLMLAGASAHRAEQQQQQQQQRKRMQQQRQQPQHATAASLPAAAPAHRVAHADQVPPRQKQQARTAVIARSTSTSKSAASSSTASSGVGSGAA